MGLLPAKATWPSSSPTVLRPDSTSSSVDLPEPEGLHGGGHGRGTQLAFAAAQQRHSSGSTQEGGAAAGRGGSVEMGGADSKGACRADACAGAARAEQGGSARRLLQRAMRSAPAGTSLRWRSRGSSGVGNSRSSRRQEELG